MESKKDVGIIVNNASVAGFETYSTIPLYSSFKHGVVALGRALGTDFHYEKTKIKVMTICPVCVKTNLHTTGGTRFIERVKECEFQL